MTKAEQKLAADMLADKILEALQAIPLDDRYEVRALLISRVWGQRATVLRDLATSF